MPKPILASPAIRLALVVALVATAILSPAAAGQSAAPSGGRTKPLRGSLDKRITTLLDEPPFNRVTWGVEILDAKGKSLFHRNQEQLFVPASVTKLIVTATATVLLPAGYRVRTSVYPNGTLGTGSAAGVFDGDLVLYGRGDPTFSERCFGADTLAPGACDSAFTALDAIAESLRAQGIRRITGKIVGDGSYFEPTLIHPSWNAWDLNWWYAAPVSGLGFHDNSVDFHITPGTAVDQPPVITWSPDLHLFSFENRARTVPADSGSTIGDNFFRFPGTMSIWAEGTVALGQKPWIESFVLPDPNLYAARALAASLQRKGIAVESGAIGTTDSTAYAAARQRAPLTEYRGRPIADIVFPILNTSQNWFAEMLLKILGRELRGVGSWDAGIDVERRFLIDSVKIDSTAFALQDGSGLAAGNLVAPHAFAQLVAYMIRHPKAAPFLAALPRSGAVGSLSRRFVGTPIEGKVVAKTGSINRVNTLAGFIERSSGPIVFAVMANAHAVDGRRILAQIDSVVVETGKTK
ncbi:MAG TPA: D-alanyl-D-alanine carboxypeptidase/D-alanyl-D-alanine-endopeptidase [Gemmatimonadales bacterium]|nr:D-alanyl-D-alanine carboxypeptidase/D-alanyl-D-alanine-endopeptidase [Gemmatimonadales bacterium]